jgi:hypothetical protein
MDRASGSERHLLVRRGLHHRFKGFERRHLLAKRGDLLLQADRPGCTSSPSWRSAVLSGHVALDAGLDLIHPFLQLGLGEVPVTRSPP